MDNDLPSQLIDLISKVTAKRARIVLDHILTHGFITTEDLKTIYGYDHPPRAVRDVRENGIPIVTFTVKSVVTGRPIAAYKFGDLKDMRHGRLGGRSVLPKSLKKALIVRYGARSTLTGQAIDSRYLQIDHRIPYEVAGNTANLEDVTEFMLLDASSQRAKSWSCEHCLNFTALKDVEICKKCFWAFPEEYAHVAMVDERRLYLVWQGEAVAFYDTLKAEALRQGLSIGDYVQQILVGLS